MYNTSTTTCIPVVGTDGESIRLLKKTMPKTSVTPRSSVTVMAELYCLKEELRQSRDTAWPCAGGRDGYKMHRPLE